ncbi:MAG: hypothetical protein WA888_15470 [Burkholderiaceae bacterium]
MKRLFAIVLCVLLPMQGYAGALMSQMGCGDGMNAQISSDCCQPGQVTAESKRYCDSGVACQLVSVCLPVQSPLVYPSPTAGPNLSTKQILISRLVTDVWRPPIVV